MKKQQVDGQDGNVGTQLIPAEVSIRDNRQAEQVRLSALATTVTSTLIQTGTVPEILEPCTQAIVDYLDAAFVRIWTLDPETNLLELQAIAGQHSYTKDFPSRISIGISIIGFIAKNREMYLSADVANDLCIGANDWTQAERLTAFAGYPLIVDDRLVGVLALFSRQAFSQDVIQTLGWLANTLAIAIDRSWAREELLSRREALLFKLANQIRNSLDIDTVLGKAVSEIRKLLKLDRCHFIWCWSDPVQPTLAITHEACDPNLSSLLGECSSEQASLLAEKILNLTLIRANDVNSDANLDTATQDLLSSLGIAAQLMIPMETRSGQLGAVVCSHSTRRFWSDSEVELLKAVVDQLAIAIDQAELYAQTRAAAFAAQTQAQQISEALQNLKHTQAQLIQSEKMSSLGQMVAGVAHEINNPVTFITGNINHAHNYIQDLLDLLYLYQKHYPDPTDEIQERVEEIDLDFVATDLPKLLSSMRIGADRIQQIVLSLRNFSRLDEADKKPVDIHEGIDSTLLILQNRLKAVGNRLSIQVIKEYGNLPRVDCYAGQLNQVFMNVLSNAIEALEEQPEPRIIKIQTEFLGGEENQKLLDDALPVKQQSVLIRIQDNGPGMTEETRKRLFDPFFTTKPVGKGTGLGLSISYQIVVEKHGGVFKCLSEPGQGAEFWIQIPVMSIRSTDPFFLVSSKECLLPG